MRLFLHIGINDKNLLKIPAVVALEQDVANFSRALHGRVLCRIEEAVLHGDIVLRKEVAAIFAYNVELRVGMLIEHVHSLLMTFWLYAPARPLSAVMTRHA